MSINGTVVLVTGAGGGSGAAIAKAFLKEGYTVYATDIQAPTWDWDNEEKLRRIALNVTDEDAIEKLAKEADASGETIQVLVNNAGIAIGAPIQDMTTEVWNKNITVNTYGTFFCTRAVVRILLEKKLSGSIINLGSIAGKNGFADTSAYCASKAAVIGFTRGLAAELGKNDITVNAICPGSVNTPMIQKVVDVLMEESGDTEEVVRKRMVSTIPLQRFQEPEDVAQLALFLGSDCARNINGESINIDGGAVRD